MNQFSFRIIRKSLQLFLSIQTFLLFTFLSVSGGRIDNGSSRKNVLILLGDDVGFETSVYGNTVVRTPNLEWLAERGTVYTNAFTSVSSCSPSRASLLTGLPSHQNGMYGLHQGVHHFNSFDKVRALPKILADHGIRTGIIGKKHVGPKSVYGFDYEQTEENNSVLQVGRNITKMKLLVQDFLNKTEKDIPFFLYIGIHDAHRCGHTHPEYGSFCQRFGNPRFPNMGNIPDWTPETYSPDQVNVPYFVPDTPTSRQDIADQYSTMNRLDQGVGLFLKEFESRGLLNNTLIIYTSDNGIPFPSGRTNLYDPGMKEPFILVNPKKASTKKRSNQMISLLDVTPTVLDWFGLLRRYPKYKVNGRSVSVYGHSLLPTRRRRGHRRSQHVFSSHSFHEITMHYPQRVIRTKTYKLIHNLAYRTAFPIDQDFYLSPTFQDLLNRSIHSVPTHWYKTLDGYYYRPQFELFNVRRDPRELDNLAYQPGHKATFDRLHRKLTKWMRKTNDPWLCYPAGVLEDKAQYKTNPTCFSAHNHMK